MGAVCICGCKDEFSNARELLCSRKVVVVVSPLRPIFVSGNDVRRKNVTQSSQTGKEVKEKLLKDPRYLAQLDKRWNC